MKLESDTRNAAADAIVDLIDGGDSAGYIILQDSGENQIAKITLSTNTNSAFNGAVAGVAEADDVPSYTINTNNGDHAGTVATGTNPYGALLYRAAILVLVPLPR